MKNSKIHDWLNKKGLDAQARKEVNKDTKIVAAFIIVLAISGYVLLKSFNLI